MIASVTSTAPSVRPSADDTAAKQKLDAAKQAQAQQAATSANSPEEPAAVVSISKQGAQQAASKPPAAEPAVAADSTPKSNKPALAFEAADTDQDGKISTFEQKSYDFRHPAALRTYKELAASTPFTAAPSEEGSAAVGAITGKSTETPGTA